MIPLIVQEAWLKGDVTLPLSQDAGTWCLLTAFSTLLCYDLAADRLFHAPLDRIPEGAQPVTFRHDVATGRLAMFRVGAPETYVRARATSVPPVAPRFGPFEVVPAGRERLVHLRVGDRFLRADNGGTQAVELRSPVAKAWETFLLVTPEDLGDLRFLLTNRWLLPSGRTLVTPERIALDRDFTLVFGDRRVALPDNLPLPFRQPINNNAGFAGATLFIDGWKLEEIRLFRPLVYFVAFGEEKILQMLEISLASLAEIADYDGDVLIITDRTASQIAPYVPAALWARTRLWNVEANDRFDYAVASYLLPHLPDAAAFQPLLYSDVDVCFDLDLREMLTRLLLHPKLSAQREQRALSVYESVGAPLLREDRCNVGKQLGFNAGVMGIPSLATHGDILSKIAETMYRFVAHKRTRRPLRWYDQPVANYVAFKTDSFDPDLLSEYVRAGDGEEGAPTGVLHLWSARPKLDAMRRYLAKLRQAKAALDAPGEVPFPIVIEEA